jgi:glycosyltransferase involved in cell wall biosynthesis
MRLGFDAIRAFRNSTGLGNYARFVLQALIEHAGEHDYMLYTPRVEARADLHFLDGQSNVHVRTPPTWAVGRLGRDAFRVFRQGAQAWRDGVDLYHGLTHEIPRDLRRHGVRSVVTMHDVLWRTMPQTYRWADRQIYDWKYGYSVLAADAVIAVSRATATAVREAWPLASDRVHVVHQGCHEAFRRPAAEADIRRVGAALGLPRDYLIQVGTVEERKNAALSVRALAALPPDLRCPLVLVGRPTAYADEVRQMAQRLGVADLLQIHQGLPLPDLVALVHGARLALYPSLGEGFGIPVLEAMSCGCPVITTDGEVFREVGGPAPLYIDPADAEGLADAIRRVLTERELADAMTQQGVARAADFSPARIAAELMSVYRQVLPA